MKIKVSEATNDQLDWLVAKCENLGEVSRGRLGTAYCWDAWGRPIEWSPTTSWEQAGPLIERENIALYPHGDDSYEAEVFLKPVRCHGPTPLIAGLRCYVASKLGDEVDTPRELE